VIHGHFQGGRHPPRAPFGAGATKRDSAVTPPAKLKSTLASAFQTKYSASMNLLVILIILLVLFGGGGFYAGGPIVGGSAAGLILLVLVVLALTGRL
jgi:hypothetical protein